MAVSRISVFVRVIGLLALLTAATAAFAQGVTGGIVGTVADESGAVVVGAQVAAINVATGVTERTMVTDKSGIYSFRLMPVGQYRIMVTAPGFARTLASGVKVRVTETTTANVTLKPGAVTEEVTVTGTAAPVDLENATTGTTLAGDVVANLPLATRNYLQILALSTGSNIETSGASSLGRGAVSISVNGQRAVNNNYQLEGINANDVNLPILDNVPLPNPDTVAEVKTQTSLYDASMGRNGGGNIQVALRSGTNAYHGSAWGFLRNNVLNANDWFLKRQQAEDSLPNKQGVLRQGKFGGSFGGPIKLGGIKDWFFYLNYEGTRQASGLAAGTTFTTNLPVLPADRSEANLRSIFFPGAPSTMRLDPVALAILNLPASTCPGFSDSSFCIPSLAGTPGFGATGKLDRASLTRSGTGIYNEDQFTATMDKQFGVNDKINLRWFWSNFARELPFGTASTLPFAMQLPQKNRFAKVGWTHTINDHTVNEARFGFNRFFFSQNPSEPITLSAIGATRGNSADFPAAFRSSIAGVGFSIGTGVNDDRGGAFNTFVAGDDLAWKHGKHQVRMGFETSRYQLNRFNRFATRGSVTFGNGASGDPNPAVGVSGASLVGFQNFLLGRVTATQAGAGFFTFYFRATDVAGYLQDDWKVTPHLTLNLGMRWEGLSVAHEKQNFLSNFRGLGDGTVGPISIIHPEATPRVGTPGVSGCTLTDCFDTNNWAPRVGFAWDMFGNQKTVLRGGYGIYYQRTSNQPLLQTAGGLPFNQSISASRFGVSAENPFPTIRPQSDFPLPTDQVIPALIGFDGTTGAPIFSGSGSALGGFFFFPERSFHSPYAQQWNLTVQREFFKNWVWEVGYVGTRGVDLIGTGRALNPSQICTTSNPCAIPASMGLNVNVPVGTPGVTKQADGSILITDSTADNQDARVPVQFLGLAAMRGFFQEQSGQSTYHSLQTSLTHQFTRGLYMQAAYTYSKSIDDSSGSAFQDELNGLIHAASQFCVRCNRGPSDFDHTHRFVVSYNYELPFAKLLGIADHGLGKIANGWAVNGSTNFQSGSPFLIVDTSNVTLEDMNGINGAYLPHLAPGKTINDVLTQGSMSDRIANYVNLSAFTSDACVTSQNVPVSCSDPTAVAGDISRPSFGRNRFRGPYRQDWQISVVKSTKVTERVNVDFRTEFFNPFNHPSFGSPQAAGGSLGGYGFVDISGGDSSILTVNDPRIIQFALKVTF